MTLEEPPLSEEEREQLRDALREDLDFLAEVLGIKLEWFHRLWFNFAWHHPRHVIEAPRGFGKSTVCTTLFAIRHLLRDHNVRILIVSRTEELAASFASEIRGHLEGNKVLKSAFGPFMGAAKWTDTVMTIAQRTVILPNPTIKAAGIEGTITGWHGEVVIADDPFNEESSRSPLQRDRAYDWLFTTLTPTLMPGATVCMRCTRYHWGDLAGKIERELATDKKTGETHIYRLEAEGAMPHIPLGSTWKVLQTPAIDPKGQSIWEARSPLEDRVNPDGKLIVGLSTLRADMGERRFGEQFLMICREIKADEQETEFKRDWFHRWELQPDLGRLEIFQFVDPAFRDREEAARRTKRDREPDFYAIAVIGFDRARAVAYVLDLFRDRLTPVERETKAKEHADRWKPRLVGVERTGLQIKEAPEFYAGILKAISPHRAKFTSPASKGNKVARAQPLARAMNKGRVLWDPTLFDVKRFPGLIDEFAAFPFGDHDDLVDAVSGAFLLGNRREMSLSAYAWQTDGSRGSEVDDRDRTGRAAVEHDDRAAATASSVADYDDRAC